MTGKTADRDAQIFAAWQAGRKNREIADEFNVSRETVRIALFRCERRIKARERHQAAVDHVNKALWSKI